MDVLTFPHRILCIKITVNYFIYLHPCSCGQKYVGMLGRLVTEKKPTQRNQILHLDPNVTKSMTALALFTE